MSAKRKKSAPQSGAVWHMSAEEATLAKKPHYNGFACGHGAHGDAKYNRSKSKRSWKAQMEKEGAPRGSFLFHLKTLPIIIIDLNRRRTQSKNDGSDFHLREQPHPKSADRPTSQLA